MPSEGRVSSPGITYRACPVCRAGEHTRKPDGSFDARCGCNCGCPFLTVDALRAASRRVTL